MSGMALEHALLVALSEQPAAGLELARRFEKSIGFFWNATHQQIYRVLGRMVADGWVSVETVAQSGKPDKKVYDVSDVGAAALADWLSEPTPLESFRSELAVKLRGASYGDRAAVLDVVRANLADHHARLAHYDQLAHGWPDPVRMTPAELDQWWVLQGGIRLERFWIDWLSDYLDAHSRTSPAEGDSA
jgi:DNA-binding PadR family transcriptional regulator